MKGLIRTICCLLSALILCLPGTLIRADENKACKEFDSISDLGPGVPKNTLVISGGSPTGLYSHTASKIRDFLERENQDIEVIVRCSGGSQANIEDLLLGRSQMAIVQSDTLHNEMNTGQIRNKINKSRAEDDQVDVEIQPIASLFPEYTQILVAKESDVENVIQLVDKRVFIGKEGSGAEANTEKVFEIVRIIDEEGNNYDRILELPDDDGQPQPLGNTKAMQAVHAGEIDAAVRVTGNVFPKLSEWKDKLKLVSLDEDLQAEILDEYSYYGMTGFVIGGERFNTLYTRAVLLVSDDIGDWVSDDLIYELAGYVSEELPADFQKGLDKGNAAIFPADKIASGLPMTFHPAAKRYFQDHDLMVDNTSRLWRFILLIWVILFVIKLSMDSRTPLEQRLYTHTGPWAEKILEFTVGQALWLLAMLEDALNSVWRSIKDGTFFKSTIFVAILGLIAFLMVATITILHYEGTHAASNDIPNQFENMSIIEFSIWLLQVLSMGESPDGLFPKSVQARAVTVVLPIIGVMGAIIAVLLATIKEKSAKERRARGLEIQPLSDHIVLCGWNGHAARVINEITSQTPGKPDDIAVLAESRLEKPLQQLGLDKDNVHFLRGMSSDGNDLQEVSANKAKSFLVLAGEEKINRHNFRSVFSVQMINKLLGDIDASSRPRIMVDMVFKENLELFTVAGADRVLNSRLIGTVFLAYSALNMGFSNVITNLMSHDTRPVICRINKSDHKKIFRKVVGQNFSTAWKTLFASGVNLLAIFPSKGEPSATMGIYPDLPDPLIIGEDDHVIAEEDSLVVIENQRLEADHVSIVSFADSQTDIQNGLDHNTPLVVIDRRNEAGADLRFLLKKRCKDLYYICTDYDPAGEEGCKFIAWDGDVRSITELVRTEVLTDLERRGIDGKIKFLIPTLEDPINYDTIEAVHKDDETVALILQLKTIDTDRFHFTAEIQCMQNLRLFKAVGVQQPIPVHEFASLALSKMTLFDGEVTGLILRFMENFFTGELESRSLRKISLDGTDMSELLVGKTFNGASVVLFEAGIQLLAIISHDGNDLNNHLIVSPHRKDADSAYGIHPNDELFVIS